MTTTTAALELIERARTESAERDRQARAEWAKRWGRDPGEAPEKISFSRMGRIDACEFRDFLNRIGIVSIHRPVYFAMGTAFDRGVDDFLYSKDLEHANRVIEQTLATEGRGVDWPNEKAWDPESALKALKNMLARMESHLRAMQPRFTSHWLSDAPIVHPETGDALRGFVLNGKLDVVDDAVFPQTGAEHTCVTDVKSAVSLFADGEEYLETKLGLQLVIYAYMARHDELLRGIPGIGDVVSYLQAQKLKTKPRKGDGWKRTFAEVTEDQFRELYYLVRAYAGRLIVMRETLESGALPWEAYPKRMSSCLGPRGKCDFLKVCRPELFDGDPVAAFKVKGDVETTVSEVSEVVS